MSKNLYENHPTVRKYEDKKIEYEGRDNNTQEAIGFTRYVDSAGIFMLETNEKGELTVKINIRKNGLASGIGGKADYLPNDHPSKGNREILRVTMLRELFEEVYGNNPAGFLTDLRENIVSGYGYYDNKNTILTGKIDELIGSETTGDGVIEFLQDSKFAFLLNRSFVADRFISKYTIADKYGKTQFRQNHFIGKFGTGVGLGFGEDIEDGQLKGVVFNLPVDMIIANNGEIKLESLREILPQENYQVLEDMLGDITKIQFNVNTVDNLKLYLKQQQEEQK